MNGVFDYRDYTLDEDVIYQQNPSIIDDNIPRDCEICGIDIILAPEGHIMCGECYHVINESKNIPLDVVDEMKNLSIESKSSKQSNISILCCKCSQEFEVPESEKWKTTCRKCYFSRECKNCKRDISELPSYKQLCDNCYKLQLITKVCYKCGREFSVPRNQSYKNLCSKSDCVEVTPTQRERIHKSLSKNGYSQKEITWLESIAQRQCIKIQHKGNGNQYIIITKLGPKKVDGYCYDTNTVYEFYGEYYHGHPTKTGTGVDGKSYKELYQKTMEREVLIREAGYTIISILEEDYDKK